MSAGRAATVAWLITAVYYFYQYTLRSAPAVMMPQLSDAFGLTAAAVAAMVGLFYYGYSPFSLVAGAALDRLGPRTVIPVGALIAGAGALLFGTGNLAAANVGRSTERSAISPRTTSAARKTSGPTSGRGIRRRLPRRAGGSSRTGRGQG